MSHPSLLQQIAPDVWTPRPEPIAGLDPVTEAKLWKNPCWLSFRFNYLALRYNTPVYDWVRRRWGLSRPEFAVIYTLGLCDNALARDISASFGFPQNTLSRAVAKLLRLGLIARRTGAEDRRSQILSLTPAGRALLEEATPRFVADEAHLLDALTAPERQTLARLLSKIVVAAARGAPDPGWPQAEPDDTDTTRSADEGEPCA
jgi:MarR family transcriptional regulator, temperature-dependent positive regulator of motility